LLTFPGDAIACATEKPAGKNPTTSKINFSVPISSTRTSQQGIFHTFYLTFVFITIIYFAVSSVPPVSRSQIGEYSKEFSLSEKVSLGNCL
jgi:hypothetical protein